MKHRMLHFLLAVCLTVSMLLVPAGAAEVTATGLTNEGIIFDYLTQELDLPTSAACGLLASAYRESRFQPEVQNSSKTSLGIFQWYGDNMTKLVNWCKENGYDAYTLDGQLAYLTYQFTEVKPFTTYYEDLKAMPETAQGAYDAGYYFCYYFERPGKRAEVSDSRGVYARDTYWVAYSQNGWKNPYVDVSANRWFFESVAYVSQKGLFNGTSATTFSPEASMSRAMMVQVLYNLAGQPDVDPTAADCFEDVPQGKWYTTAVAWAKEYGIVEGTSETTFDPNADITREQMVQMLYRYAQDGTAELELAAVDLSGYPDYDQVTFGKEAMSWAVSVGLISGVKQDDIILLAPKQLTNRAQVATLLRNYCEAG